MFALKKIIVLLFLAWDYPYINIFRKSNMVRNFKRKTIRGNFSKQSILLAIDSIKFKKMSLRKAILIFNVNKVVKNSKLKKKEKKKKSALGKCKEKVKFNC